MSAHQSAGHLQHFYTELKRRRVLHTAAWYTGGALSVLGALSQVVFPALAMSQDLLRPMLIIALFGLPVALTLSWEYDVYSAARSTDDRTRSVIPVAVVALLSLSGAWVFVVGVPRPRRLEITPADPKRIAVLPFKTNSTDAAVAAFAATLQDRLIDGLNAAADMRVPDEKRLHVVSSTVIAPYTKPDVTADSISRMLNVGTIIDGTVEVVGDAVRVNVRMTDPASGDLITTRTAEKRSHDHIALLEEVGDSVLQLVRHEFPPLVVDRALRLETRNPDAYLRYSLGKQRLKDLESAGAMRDSAAVSRILDDADRYLAEAQKLDNKWIEPPLERCELARTRVIAMSSFAANQADSTIREGLRHAQRALKISPNDYRALQARGRLEVLAFSQEKVPQARQQWVERADADLRLSLVQNPAPAKAYRALSELASATGRIEDALSFGQMAYSKDPYLQDVGATLLRLFEYSLQLGKDGDAVRFCREGRTHYVDAIFDDCRLSLGAWVTTARLSTDSARIIIEHEKKIYEGQITSNFEARLAGLYAAILARNGQADSARAVIRSALARDDGVTVSGIAAGVYSIIGDRSSALRIIQKLLARWPDQRGALEHAPELRLLRSDPEFRRLLQFKV